MARYELDLMRYVYPPVALILKPAPGAWDRLDFRIVDEQGTTAATGKLESPHPRRVELAPGLYTLVVRDQSGAKRFQTSFELRDEPLLLPISS